MQTTIREATLTDAPAIAAIYAPIVSDTAISFEEEPPSPEEMGQRIETTLLSYPYLVAERLGQVVGYAYASQHRARPAYRWSADVSVYVHEQARSAGVGRALYEQLLAQLATRNFHAVFAGIALPNSASVALHEAVGFSLIGVYREVGFKLGEWRDVGWWQLVLGDR